MHTTDIICMTSISHEVDLDLPITEILELLQLVPNRSVNYIKEENISSEDIKRAFGAYAKCSDNLVVFEKEACQDLFKSLYVSFVSKATSLTFENFCNKDYISELKYVSEHTPIILYCDKEVGLLVGVLEDFLRMPEFSLDKEYKVTALYSRHS